MFTNMDTREERDMSDDKKPDSENKKDDKEPSEAEGGDNGSADAAAPAGIRRGREPSTLLKGSDPCLRLRARSVTS